MTTIYLTIALVLVALAALYKLRKPLNTFASTYLPFLSRFRELITKRVATACSVSFIFIRLPSANIQHHPPDGDK